MILSAADFSAYAQSEAQDAQVPQEVEKQEESQQENLQNEEKNSKKTQNSDKEEDFNEVRPVPRTLPVFTITIFGIFPCAPRIFALHFL